ncbi:MULTISPECIES: hypothetical protein [unclassified Amycolatopsis]|uniref:hypothetical protein n=1 Tax=unclassified Amycolatopsis TaxID=2618356 RepID=UPI003456D7F7
MLYDYFVAVDDATAARLFVDGDTAKRAGYPELVVKGADPVFDLLPIEAALTGRTIAEVEADPHHCPEIKQEGDEEPEVFVVSLADAFRDSLATAGDAALHDAAVAFVARNEGGEVEPIVAFLKELAVLARGAAAEEHRLYCNIVI